MISTKEFMRSLWSMPFESGECYTARAISSLEKEIEAIKADCYGN